MSDNLALYVASTDVCPTIDEPGIETTKIIQAVIVGVILWFLLSKR